MTADFTDSSNVAARMVTATRKLHEMSNAVGRARQVKEFCSDRRKNLLSAEAVKFLREGDSVAAAEHKARASEIYQAKLGELEKQMEEAEVVICKWSAEDASFKAAQSLLSYSRESLKTMPE
jgi:hypothetical protein